MTMTLELLIAFLIGATAVGRATRLIVDDDMPVFKWFRETWVMFFVKRERPSVAELIVCPFCVSIWLAFGSTLWAFLSDLHWTWWFLHLMLAGAYIAAMINVRDIPAE